MSLGCPIGPEANILEPSEQQCRRLYLEQPILSPEDLVVISQSTLQNWKVTSIWSALNENLQPFCQHFDPRQTRVVDITVDANQPLDYVVELDRICQEVCEAVNQDYQFIVLSDKKAGPQR